MLTCVRGKADVIDAVIAAVHLQLGIECSRITSCNVGYWLLVSPKSYESLHHERILELARNFDVEIF